MKFLLDVHFGSGLARLLEEKGHHCRLVSQVADLRSSDAFILSLARENNEIVLTHDLDFGTLLAFSQANQPSVVIFRIEKINNERFAELLLANWDLMKDPLEKGALVVIESHSVRIRELPI